MKKENAGSSSAVDQTQAGSQTTGTQAGAGSAAQQAGTQTGQAQSGAGAAAQGSLAQEETVADVGQGEAYILNMKRLVASELSLDAHLNQVLVASAQRLARNAEDHDNQLRQLAMTSLSNAVALANRVNNSAIDLDNRIKQNAVDADGRKTGNDEQFDKNLDNVAISERERTVRNGDVLDVIREAGVSADSLVYQDVIERLAVKVAAKLAK